MKSLSDSELILNQDGTIYHLCLRPGEVASTVFTVGDPQRVKEVSRYFDEIYLERGNREFIVHTGRIGKTDVSVLSTGMGTDNIDIVWNELDALFNVDFETRTVKDNFQAIKWVRLGTSGSIQPDIKVGSLVYSKRVIGLEGLMSFYQTKKSEEESSWQEAFQSILPNNPVSMHFCDTTLEKAVQKHFTPGNTATFGGFYAPQGRSIRAASKYPDIMDQIAALRVKGEMITNMEMETAGIYGLAEVLGHQAISLNAIIANRATGEFSHDYRHIIESMITNAIDALI